MPIFDYLCEDCGEKSEILTTVSNEQPECSACGSKNLKKMISKPSSFPETWMRTLRRKTTSHSGCCA